MSQQTQDRRWEIVLEADGDGYPDHRGFEADVQNAMAESAAILLRLGGAIQSYVVRQEGEDGLWYPVRAVFKWQSFVPGIRAPKRQPAPEPQVEMQPESVRERVERLVEDNAEALEVLSGREPEPGELVEEGQLFERGDERQVAASIDEQQVLLADGWVPVGVA